LEINPLRIDLDYSLVVILGQLFRLDSAVEVLELIVST
jgi:hypothetical protein